MRKEVLESFHKWLKFDDEYPLDIVMACGLAVLFPGDPLWLLVVGAPGAGKTEMVRAFKGQYVYPLEILTSNTLISGLRDNNNQHKRHGILQDLDNKLLVIKDLTTMLQSTSNARSETNVFNQLRAAYDGELSAAHGSGLKKQDVKSRFGLIAAVTPVVDRFRALNSSLGERFVTVRIHQDSAEAIKKAQEHTGLEDQMRPELQTVVEETLNYYQKCGNMFGVPSLDNDDLKKIQGLGELIAKLRTEVDRDSYKRTILSIPEAEIGTRLVKQFTRLGQMLKLYGGYDYRKITRVARDSIHPIRLRVASALYNEYKGTAWSLHENIDLAHQTVKESLEDMWLLGLCEREVKGKAEYFNFKPDIIDLIMETGVMDVEDN